MNRGICIEGSCSTSQGLPSDAEQWPQGMDYTYDIFFSHTFDLQHLILNVELIKVGNCVV